MYCNFYGLSQKPFELAPAGNLVYFSEAHREGVATLRYGVIADKGFLLLTGGVGTGKTTLLNYLLGVLHNRVQVCVLNNPTLSRDEFLHYLGGTLGIGYKGNKGEFILQFANLLERCRKRKSKILLIIDEAQVFPIDLLEEIRLLSNHAGEHNVLSIFLIGQPELQEKLANPQLLPLRQRIGIRFHLEPLTREDTGHYIAYRLNKAGATNSALFSPEAVDCIHEASQGNPRLINVICDHAMISGFVLDKKQIDRDIVLECLQQIRLQGETGLRISTAPEKTGGKTEGQNAARQPSKSVLVILGLLTVLASTALLWVFVVQKWLVKI